ncbi:MAG: class I SAM-dependent methyltransferase [Desulfurococcales archaeon]|nr:class I SAM-dependent methyltransferase [Desulfurococcales archaeon]
MKTVRVFDEHSDRYDNWFNRNPILASNELETVKKLLSKKKDPCIEIGVGTGWFSSKIKCSHGVDPSIGMLKKARQRGIEVIQGYAEQLPLKSRAFRTVLMIVTLCFVEDPYRALEESVRTVRSDGSLIICIVPRDSQWGKYYIELGMNGHPFYSVAKFYTQQEVESYMNIHGFYMDSCLGVLRFPPQSKAVREEPEKCSGKEGFICMRFKQWTPRVSRSYR